MNVADKLKKEEKITPEDVRGVLDNIDWGLYGVMLTWKLNYPKTCDCNSCGKFQNWKKWGEEIYEKHPEVKEKITTEIAQARERREKYRKIRLSKDYSNQELYFSHNS